MIILAFLSILYIEPELKIFGIPCEKIGRISGISLLILCFIGSILGIVMD